jgi:MSHA biogenesis protein MshP
MKKLQKGFSIVTAIFVLVVLAFLGAAMVTFSTNQQQSVAMDVMGMRAYQAARSGVEWTAYKVLPGGGGAGACAGVLPPGSLTGTLSGFTVTVTCVATVQAEGAGVVTVLDLTSIATQGAVGQPDYVERELRVTIAL